MRKIVPWIVVVLVLVGAGYGVWRWRASKAEPDIVYKTTPAEKRRIVGKITASGTLSALVTVQVGSQVSGRVQALNADFNSKVTKGQLIAKIDPQLFQATLQQAQAAFLSAKANLTKAEAEARRADLAVARSRELRKEGLLQQADLETAEATATTSAAQVEVARAALEQARATLNQAQVNLSYTNILSPIDGVVISRNVDVGQTVAASLQAPVLFTIAEDLRKMQVDTNVAEGDVGRLEAGMRATFTVDAFPGQRFVGHVDTIRNAPQTLQNVVTYDAVIKVDNDALKLRPGMTANVTIVYAEKEDVLAVPNTALRFKPPASVPEPKAPAAKSAAPQGSEAAPTPAPSGSGGGRRGGGAGRGERLDVRAVWVKQGTTVIPVWIKTGLSDGTWTEIAEVIEGTLDVGTELATESTGGASATAATTPGSPLGGPTPPAGGRRTGGL